MLDFGLSRLLSLLCGLPLRGLLRPSAAAFGMCSSLMPDELSPI